MGLERPRDPRTGKLDGTGFTTSLKSNPSPPPPRWTRKSFEFILIILTNAFDETGKPNELFAREYYRASGP